MNEALPEYLPTPPEHDSLAGAASHVDEKTKEPYLKIQDLDEGKIRVIKMNRLKAKNGFDDWMYLVLSDALNQAEKNEKVLVVILTGEGDYFSSGADLRAEMAGGQGLKLYKGNMFDPVGVFMRTVIRFPKPLIAAVNGPAIGVGCTILPHCDIVYMTETTTLLCPFSLFLFFFAATKALTFL